MKLFSLLLSTFMTIMPFPFCLDKQTGFLIDSNRPSEICVNGEGDVFKENIKIQVKTLGEKIEIKPIHDNGYQPKTFVGNFLDNGLEQLLYAVDSGGSGGYSYYEMYSLKNMEKNLIFNSDNFSPIINAEYLSEQTVQIDYQGQKLFIDISKNKCPENVDCEIFVSSVNSIFPYYNMSLDRYYLQVLQRVYGGYSANNYGYIVSLLQINEDGYDIIDIGTISNFDYINF